MKGTVTKKANQGEKRSLDCCHRCGGLMASELSLETGVVEWHCVMCGNRVDQVILAHRLRHEPQQEQKQLFAGSGHSRLN